MNEIKTWSFSRLSTLTSCAKKYAWKYIDKLVPLKKGLNFERGTIVHEIARATLSPLGSDWTPDRVKDALLRNSTVEEIDEVKDLEKLCVDIIKAGELLARETERIVAQDVPGVPIQTFEENLKFEIKKGNGQTGGVMTSYLDFHAVDEAGANHVIVEWKSSSRSPAGNDATLDNKKQAIIYSEAFQQQYAAGGKLSYYIVYVILLQKETKLITIPVDFAAFKFAEDIISELWDQVRWANEMEKNGSFPRSLSARNCNGCEYAELCLYGQPQNYKPKEETIVVPDNIIQIGK